MWKRLTRYFGVATDRRVGECGLTLTLTLTSLSGLTPSALFQTAHQVKASDTD
jgi:hypothetical protein